MSGTVGGAGEDAGSVSRYIHQMSLYALSVGAPSVFPGAKVIVITTSDEIRPGLAGTGLHESVERFQRRVAERRRGGGAS